MRISTIAQACGGIAMSLVFAFLVLRQVNSFDIGEALLRADVLWIFIALAFYWAEILTRVIRWRRILNGGDSKVCFLDIVCSFLLSAAANNIFPFRLGDVMRAHLVGIQRGVSRYSLMGTIVLEKIIDVVAILLITFLGAFGVLSKLGLLSNLYSSLVIFALALFALFGAGYLIRVKYISNSLVVFFSQRIAHFTKGFRVLLDPISSAFVFFETLVIWILNTLAIWATVKSLGATLSVSEVLLLEGMTGLAAAIPSAPAGIGTLQYAFLLTFGMMHLDRSVGVAASVLVQGVLLGSITLVGVLVFIYDSRTRQVLRRISHD